MDLKTKRAICLLVGIASVLTIVGTVSYAYFTALGETQTQEATISTGTARVRFADGNNGITKELSFGESVEKTFTIENTGTAESKVKMYWKDIVNTYLPQSLTYTLSQSETSDGPYTEIVGKKNVPKNEEEPTKPTNKELSELITVPVGKTYYFKLVITLNYLSDVNQDSDITATFSSSFDLKDINYVEKTFADLIAKDSNGVKTGFNSPATTDEGIFEMEDDYGTSYYYRGAVENNYVKYGVNAAGQEMWWRIIRVNGDGSLRIVYDGTQGYANGTSNNDRFAKVGQVYNAKYNDAKYVGWMYGPAGTTASTSKEQAQSNIASSDAKVYVDQWYKENIVDTGYGNNVSDEIFCNDRSTPGKELTGWISDTGKGFGSNYTAYGATARTQVWNSKPSAPTFKCPQKNDAFTVSDTEKGNGALEYPVGLITADEIVAAGSGKFGTINSNYYLYKSSSYYQWSLSPYYYNGINAYVFGVNASGLLYSNNVNDTLGAVAPVINLSTEYAVTLKGTGTIADPYRA